MLLKQKGGVSDLFNLFYTKFFLNAWHDGFPRFIFLIFLFLNHFTHIGLRDFVISARNCSLDPQI